MELKKIPAIFLIDDEEIVNLINKTVIRRAGYQGQIFDFDSGNEAFASIEKLIAKNPPPATPYLLLLDLNMPDFSGWDFLNKFLSLEDNDRKQFKISILTSSVSPEDVKKSETFEDVVQFSFKPLTVETFQKIIHSI